MRSTVKEQEAAVILANAKVQVPVVCCSCNKIRRSCRRLQQDMTVLHEANDALALQLQSVLSMETMHALEQDKSAL